MRINGNESFENKEETKVEKKNNFKMPKMPKLPKLPKFGKSGDVETAVMHGDNSKINIITTVTAILTIVCLLAFLVLGVINIKDWWVIRSTEKDIAETYSEDIMNNKVYIEVEVITAKIEGYEEGILHTDFGDIECKNPGGTVILAYYNLDGELKPMTEMPDANYGVEYVTSNFEAPEGSIIVASASDKGTYLDYIHDVAELTEMQNSKKTEMSLLWTSLVGAVVCAGLFVLTRAGLFDKLVSIKKPEEDEAESIDFGNELPELNNEPVKTVKTKKPPIKTDVDPGN